LALAGIGKQSPFFNGIDHGIAALNIIAALQSHAMHVELFMVLVIVRKPGSEHGNRGQNTVFSNIESNIVDPLFIFYARAARYACSCLSFCHRLDFVFEVIAPKYQFLI
jgi:hypothetical protein